MLTCETVDAPIYDFSTHSRKNETIHIEPKPILILEGILIFVDAALRELMDIKIFVDTADDLRFIRRLQRDVQDRGRTVETVIKQYLDTVRPMHEQLVESLKRLADVVNPEVGYNEVGIDLSSGKIRAQLRQELSRVQL